MSMYVQGFEMSSRTLDLVPCSPLCPALLIEDARLACTVSGNEKRMMTRPVVLPIMLPAQKGLAPGASLVNAGFMSSFLYCPHKTGSVRLLAS